MVNSSGITDSPEVASALAYFIMAAAGALTLYATSHWSPANREKREVRKRAKKGISQFEEDFEEE